MGVRHKTLIVEGVQFHPESILTEHGHAMLANFLKEARVMQYKDLLTLLLERQDLPRDAMLAAMRA